MNRIVLGNLELDRDRFEVRIDGQPVALSFIQFELLYHLALRADRVVDRDELARLLWGTPSKADARKLRIHVSRLRRKLSGSRPWHIKTVTKRGYALVKEEGTRLPAFALVGAPTQLPALKEGGSL
jgi:DNA-binding response OmpR family regulator